MIGAYITFDELNLDTGAGKVCLHEIGALKKVLELKQVISRGDLGALKNYPEGGFNPFLADYFATRAYEYANRAAPGVDLLHLSCSPGLALLDYIRPDHYVVNIVAHDLEVSISEHERIYGKGSYQFKHNTDPYLHGLLLDHTAGADRVITPSNGSRRWIEGHISNSEVMVIPHGTDIPGERDIGPYPKDLRFGYLGAFGPDKGLVYLLMAWKFAQNLNAKISFGGNCKDGVYQAARWINMPQGQADKIEYLGWIKDVKDFYNGISVYIQPSVTEGFGIEVLESMSYGRPVIVADGTGAVDLVEDGVNGFVVPSRDSRILLDRMKFFQDHPELISEMGKAARERSLSYSWDRIESRYMKMYEEVLVTK